MNSLKETFIGGVYYTALAKYSAIIINLVVTAILSRILPPHDFGIIAIAMVFITFFSIISDVGIGSAIIQKKELDNKDISSIFTFTVYLACIFSLLFFFSSPLLAKFYNEPILENVCKLLSINLFFSICNIVPNGLLLKAKKFKYITYRTLFIQFIAGIISVISVFNGAGIYALLINPILSAIAIFVINYIKTPISFSFIVKFSSIQKIWSYSVFQFLFSLINYFSRNLDNILIGKYAGFIQLGYYEKSYRLMTLPFAYVSNVLTAVMHPVFSDYQNDLDRINDYYLKILRLLAVIGFPLSIYLFFNAKEFIILLFGEQWAPSIPIFQILSLSIGFQMVVSSAGSIFQSANSTKLLFIDGLISTFFTVSLLFVGLFFFKKVLYVAFFISVSYIINSFKSFFILSRFVLKQRLILLLKEFIRPIGIALFLGFILYFIDLSNINLIWSLLIKTLISLFIVMILVHILKIYDLKIMIRNIIKR